jgi:hypothetical protein
VFWIPERGQYRDMSDFTVNSNEGLLQATKQTQGEQLEDWLPRLAHTALEREEKRGENFPLLDGICGAPDWCLEPWPAQGGRGGVSTFPLEHSRHFVRCLALVEDQGEGAAEALALR